MVLRSKSVYILKTLNALLEVLKKSIVCEQKTTLIQNQTNVRCTMKCYTKIKTQFFLFYFIFLTAVFLKGHGKKFVAKLKKISEARSQFYYSVANVNTPCNPH